MKIFIFESEIKLKSRIYELKSSFSGSVSIVIDRGNEIFSNHDFVQSDFKVYVLRESFPWGNKDRWALANQDKFDLFVTTQKSVISDFTAPCIYVPFATSWVEPIGDICPEKDYAISYMPGRKIMREFEGHAVRHNLYAILEKDGISKFSQARLDLFPPSKWVDKKETIFDPYQFSIVIENVISDGWFTEKLVDCFLRKTVPIYRGDPSIGDIFDPAGIFAFTDGADFVSSTAKIEKDTYRSLERVIQYNYDKALSFITPTIPIPQGETMNSFNGRAIKAVCDYLELKS